MRDYLPKVKRHHEVRHVKDLRRSHVRREDCGPEAEKMANGFFQLYANVNAISSVLGEEANVDEVKDAFIEHVGADPTDIDALRELACEVAGKKQFGTANMHQVLRELKSIWH